MPRTSSPVMESLKRGDENFAMRVANYSGGLSIRAHRSLADLFPHGCHVTVKKQEDCYKVTMLNRAGRAKISVRKNLTGGDKFDYVEQNFTGPPSGDHLPIHGVVVVSDVRREQPSGISFTLPLDLPPVQRGSKPDKSSAPKSAAPRAASISGPAPTSGVGVSVSTLKAAVEYINARKLEDPENVILSIQADGTLKVLAEYG